MVKEFPDKRGNFEEDPQEAPPGWAQVQAKLAGNGPDWVRMASSDERNWLER